MAQDVGLRYMRISEHIGDGLADCSFTIRNSVGNLLALGGYLVGVHSRAKRQSRVGLQNATVRSKAERVRHGCLQLRAVLLHMAAGTHLAANEFLIRHFAAWSKIRKAVRLSAGLRLAESNSGDEEQ